MSKYKSEEYHKDGSKLGYKDVYERLWEGRDFEINHLWQRSIFLATFLVMIFTAYCGLWVAVIGAVSEEDLIPFPSVEIETRIDVDGLYYSERIDGNKSLDVIGMLKNSGGISAGFIVISSLGALFSLLWVFMTKGSKYWYERHESALDYIYRKSALYEDSFNAEWIKEEFESRIEWRMTSHTPIQGHLPECKWNQSIYSVDGAAFSMSKVNIVIGQIFFIFWFCASMFHIVVSVMRLKCFTVISIVIAVLFAWFWIVVLLKRKVAGGEYRKDLKWKERNFIWSYGAKRKKNREENKALVIFYEDHILSLGTDNIDNDVFLHEKRYLDSRINGKLKYIDSVLLTQFLEEFAAPDYFYKICPRNITAVTLKNLLSNRLNLKNNISYRYFADLKCIPEFRLERECNVYVEKYRIQCVAVDGYGRYQGAVVGTYHKKNTYAGYVEYEFFDEDGRILHREKDKLLVLKDSAKD